MPIKVKYKVDFAQVKPALVFTQRSGDSKPVCRVARQLALARHIQQLVDEAIVQDYATAAKVLGITRARMSQIMNLLHLSPQLQESILNGKLMVSERRLRSTLRYMDWEAQAVAIRN